MYVKSKQEIPRTPLEKEGSPFKLPLWHLLVDLSVLEADASKRRRVSSS